MRLTGMAVNDDRSVQAISQTSLELYEASAFQNIGTIFSIVLLQQIYCKYSTASIAHAPDIRIIRVFTKSKKNRCVSTVNGIANSGHLLSCCTFLIPETLDNYSCSMKLHIELIMA